MAEGQRAADPYAEISAWYDVEHDRHTDDISWLLNYLADSAPQRAAVLEIGAGTGRIAAALASAGHVVTAVEPSEAMRRRFERRLKTLPEEVARRVRIVAGNALDLSLPQSDTFDVAVFSLNTFLHLTSPEARVAALRNVLPHIRPSGHLLLDLDLAGPHLLAEQPNRMWWQGTWPVPESNAVLSHFIVAEPLRSSERVSVTHFYDVQDQGGAVVRTIAEMDLALLTRGEVELSLTTTGYEVEDVFVAYEGPAETTARDHLVFVARPASRS